MTRWDPWDVAGRRPDIVVVRCYLPRPFRGALLHVHGLTIIAIRNGLPSPDERVVLAEELIHEERSLFGCPLPALDPRDVRNVREERAVYRLVLERLIPIPAVLRMEEQIRFLGGFNPWWWADELDVPARCVWELFVDIFHRACSRGLAWPSELLLGPRPGSMLAYRLAAPIPIYRTAAG